MRIAVFGKGNVGGGLADVWERAGHQLTRLGRKGGDVSDADVVLVAVPGGSIVDVIFAISEGMGDYVYRFAPIERL
jgi:predicted dinucleotide-binding enzyme